MAKAKNSVAKAKNSVAKAKNSVAKAKNSVAKAKNSVAKAKSIILEPLGARSALKQLIRELKDVPRFVSPQGVEPLLLTHDTVACIAGTLQNGMRLATVVTGSAACTPKQTVNNPPLLLDARSGQLIEPLDSQLTLHSASSWRDAWSPPGGNNKIENTARVFVPRPKPIGHAFEPRVLFALWNAPSSLHIA
jgi:hypothetical protein